MANIFLFSDTAQVAEVGGKGYSLMHMAHGGLPVPPGMVLGVGFFETWIDSLQAIEPLRLQQDDSDAVLQSKTSALQDAARSLRFDETQAKDFAAAMHSLGLSAQGLCSVRSSSPEEDMAGASFAGMYETYLGVAHDDLEARIRDVFVSCIDYRVVAYKRRKGFDWTRYSIAVVVMEQIASEVAGVAFSINPLNNCYDEVVINANFGLGESVVSGMAVPDEFVVDKPSMKVLSSTIGRKGRRIDIAEGGGTCSSDEAGSDEATLDSGQVLALAGMVKKVEDYYGKPMDTEWAYADGRFYMLQARPITTWIPLHPDFQTEPGAPRKLYLDLTLIEQGIQRPLSVMGTDCFCILSNEMGLSAAGVPVAEKPGDFIYGAGGRAYVNLTKELMLEGREGTAREYEGLDAYAASIIRNVDLSRYVGKPTVKGALTVLKGVVSGLFRSGDTIAGIVKGSRHPEELRKRIDEKGVELIRAIDDLDSPSCSFAEFVRGSMRLVADFIVHESIPSLVVGESAKSGLKKLVEKEISDPELLKLADLLDRGLPHNVTMEMNCRIYALASMLPAEQLRYPDRIAEQIASGQLPERFLKGWDDFMDAFGFRGPREIDVKTPRYQDNPSLVLEQMRSYASLPEDKSPEAILRQQAATREEACGKIRSRMTHPGKFDRLYEELVQLGGYREIHKYYLVYAGEKIRYRVLNAASQLVEEGRIDCVEDAFCLRVDELQKAIGDAGADVRAMVADHRSYMETVEHIDHFPPVIDSRGTILFPPRPEPAEGEMVGIPVSSGRVSGKVVVIDHVGEKPVENGAILVAKAADPGWTPLFINAGGIILEVGGMLQHGSLIAREYGKPCITGIERVTDTLKDGDMVEMDGSTGIVRLL